MNEDPIPTLERRAKEKNLTSAGQRRINLIWEYTQSTIAIMIIASNMIVGIYQGLGFAKESSFPVILSSALFLVIGFYFARTNHTAIGGTGTKPVIEYQGR